MTLDSVVHGYSEYTNYACRCSVCRRANADYQAGQRAKLRSEWTPAKCPLHHVSTCPCSAMSPGQYEVGLPFAVGLWVCANGHGVVGGPVRLTPRTCFVCGGWLTLASTTIIPSRAAAAGVARDD